MIGYQKESIKKSIKETEEMKILEDELIKTNQQKLVKKIKNSI